MNTIVFIFGFCVGGLIGALVVALAVAADKEVPRVPAMVRVYPPNGATYRILRLKPGQSLGVRGLIIDEHAHSASYDMTLSPPKAPDAFGRRD